MRQPIRSMLVPTDGSDGALIGARRGIDLASALGARLHVLSVIDTRDLESPPWSPSSDRRSEPAQARDEQAERAVERIAEAARTHLAQPVTTAVVEGIPYRSIAGYADSHAIDLVVMGTHGRTGLERVLLGSVAGKTLRTTSVPILMVPPTADIIEIGAVTYENLLLPTDGSEGAKAAFDVGISLAAVYDATVHAVYSVDTSRFPEAKGIAELHEALEQFGRDALDEVRTHARSAGLTVEGSIGSGPAAQLILDYCEDHDIDLVVIGTHGRSGIDRHLVGSVTEKVVRHADVPVCCVPMAEVS